MSRTRKPSEEGRVSPVGVLEEADGRKLIHSSRLEEAFKFYLCFSSGGSLRTIIPAIHCQNQQAVGRQSADNTRILMARTIPAQHLCPSGVKEPGNI